MGAADSAADQPEYPLCKLEASDPLVRYLDIWALAELRLGQPGLIPQPAVELLLKQLEIFLDYFLACCLLLCSLRWAAAADFSHDLDVHRFG